MAAYFAWRTIRSQQAQIAEQQEFIAEQSSTMALERQELLALAADRRIAQARLVKVEAVHLDAVHDADGSRLRGAQWDVLVENLSDAPIREVLAKFGDAYLPLRCQEYNVHGVPIDGPDLPMPLPVAAPNRSYVFKWGGSDSATVHNSRPLVSFQDARGVTWLVDEHGAISERPVPSQ